MSSVGVLSQGLKPGIIMLNGTAEQFAEEIHLTPKIRPSGAKARVFFRTLRHE